MRWKLQTSQASPASASPTSRLRSSSPSSSPSWLSQAPLILVHSVALPLPLCYKSSYHGRCFLDIASQQTTNVLPALDTADHASAGTASPLRAAFIGGTVLAVVVGIA